MTDLNRDDAMVQPLHVPILSSDGENYTAPGEGWDGSPTREPLSSGAEATGIAPDDDFFAQLYNDHIGRLGQGLATVIDSPALNSWADTQAPNTDEPNDNHWSSAGVATGATTVTAAPGHYYSGI